ncbi:hypothetical protein ABPG72_000066 [Tetrahymena utriculariae]
MFAKKGKAKNGKIGSEFVDGEKKDLAETFEGSLTNKYYIFVTLKDGSQRKAKILSCRLSKSYNGGKKTDSSYDYYVHFIGLDRRNDCWVTRRQIQPTTELYAEAKHHGKGAAIKKIETEENHEHEGCNEEDIERHREATKIKTIEKIKIGKLSCDTWYYSPYPKGYHNIEYLYICEFCLSFYLTQQEMDRHSQKCLYKHPPGEEIYRDEDNKVSMFEVDGKKNKVYGENLAYLAKLFLDHKTLWRDMDPFIFYVLCENDEEGSHIVGYFSKEKSQDDGKQRTPEGQNLSCILVLPCHQRKGYGKFLISFSYQLSIIEGKLGTPERPLSDLGKASYLSWWTQRIIEYLNQMIEEDKDFSLKSLSQTTGIIEKDILWTLEQKKLIKYYQGDIIICTDQKKLQQIYDECGKREFKIHSQDIHWVPHKPKWIAVEEPVYPKYNPTLHFCYQDQYN